MKVKTQKPKEDYLIQDLEKNMSPLPIFEEWDYIGSGKLTDKKVLIVGGDSGIGKAVAILFAKEGADICFTYYENETKDALDTLQRLEEIGAAVTTYKGDVGNKDFATFVATQIHGIDILIYNSAEQHYDEKIEEICPEQIQRVFQTNVFGAIYFVQEILPKMNYCSNIIFTNSITSKNGNPELLEYAASKGALYSLMKSLGDHQSLKERFIRVNAVAPGPVWTPLIPATIPNYTENWGKSGPFGTYCHPVDVAPAYLFLASNDAKYINKQTIYVNAE